MAGSSPFPTTHWTQIGLAGGSDVAAAVALARVLARYAPAMRAHLVRRKGLREQDAEDCVQSFVAVKFLEQNLVAQARKERGKFRTFVLTALDRFLVSEHRREAAAKRGGQATVVPFEPTLGHDGVVDDPFEVDWAEQVVRAAVSQMKERCHQMGRPDIWGVFEARVVRPTLESAQPLEYADLVKSFGFRSPDQASNILMTAKRMFLRVLREIVGEYAASEEEIEAEIGELMAALGGP